MINPRINFRRSKWSGWKVARRKPSSPWSDSRRTQSSATGIAIGARQLSQYFGNRIVLRSIDVDIMAGESVGLTGVNGAGKTTLLRCFASVIRPSEGDVFWFEGAANNRRAAREMIGMVTHDPPLYPQLTLRENLVFAARMYRVGEPAVRADQLLQRVGLAHRADHRPTQISRGMRQRVAVARALVHAPNILLLDEPFSGLDAEGIHWLTETLNDLRSRDRTICFASHDTARVHCLADRVFELDSGQLHRRNFDRASEGHGHIIRARAA